jgi:hypothetical protein
MSGRTVGSDVRIATSSLVGSLVTASATTASTSVTTTASSASSATGSILGPLIHLILKNGQFFGPNLYLIDFNEVQSIADHLCVAVDHILLTQITRA